MTTTIIITIEMQSTSANKGINHLATRIEKSKSIESKCSGIFELNELEISVEIHEIQ